MYRDNKKVSVSLVVNCTWAKQAICTRNCKKLGVLIFASALTLKSLDAVQAPPFNWGATGATVIEKGFHDIKKQLTISDLDLNCPW